MTAAEVLRPEVVAAFDRAAERFLNPPAFRPGYAVEVFTRGTWHAAAVADACDVPGCVVVRFVEAPPGCVPGGLYVVLDYFVRHAAADRPHVVLAGVS
jgi:hypothetical protein